MILTKNIKYKNQTVEVKCDECIKRKGFDNTPIRKAVYRDIIRSKNGTKALCLSCAVRKAVTKKFPGNLPRGKPRGF